ncbi:jg24041 [Pararge aegeria aegeria]|uniref:Jg24041 protein n=1 Tax=Pararge aegeria aegeria TaxID=348720 RepID=A0A8S4S1S8_9NEOP|nr:jg24041 [Pararge aegeria aegeria]
MENLRNAGFLTMFSFSVEAGVPITLAQTSSQQARSKWFVLDVVGTLPIFEFIHDGHFAGLNKLLRLPKVFRVLKTVEDDCVYHSNILRFFSYSLLLMMSCFLLASLQQGFMCFQEDYDSCLENVIKFLIRNDVDPILRDRFKEYLQLCWYTDKAFKLYGSGNTEAGRAFQTLAVRIRNVDERFVRVARIPTFFTVRAVTHVEVFTISRKHLVNAINIPQITEALDFCKELPQYARLQIRRAPFMTHQPPKRTPNMEKFRYPRKYEQDNAFLEPFYRLGIFSVLRYIFPRFTIRPDGRYVVYFEWFRAICAFLSAMLYPGYTYLVLQWPILSLVTLYLDATAYYDLFQRMLVGYYNEHGILVYHPASTAAHYLKGAFLVDLFGCLPLEKLESSWKETFKRRYREAPTKQFLMLNRLIQLYRLPSALLGLNGLVRRDLLLVIRAFPIFLALLNVLTCFVVYFSVDIFFTKDNEDSSWYIVPKDDNGGSWIKVFHSACVIITTYFSIRIISVRSNVNKALASFQEHMKDISVFMKKEKLDSKLQKQVNEYYEYNWDRMGGIDYRNVLKLCSQITLRTDAILHIYGPTFNKCPILNKCDISLLRIMGRAVRSLYFLKDTTVIEKDDVISDIYFIDRGSVAIKNCEDEDEFVTLGKGSMFGNLEGASTIRCPISIKSTSQVHLLQINSQAFFSIISEFPAVLKLLNSYRPYNEKFIPGIASLTQFDIKDRSTTSSLIFRKETLNPFNVNHSLIRIYLTIISLSSIYADVYNAGFEDNRPMLIIYLYFLDICFLGKFFFQYMLPQMTDTDEDISKTLTKIRKNYMRREFKIDLISCLPIEILCLFNSSNRGTVFAWLRLNRIFRIVAFVSVLQVVSVMMYMIYVGELSNIIQYKSFRAFKFYSKHLELQNFVFKDCEPAFLRQLVGFMKLYTYTEDMYVVKEGEITDSMYIMHTGRVREISESQSKSYQAGEHFGLLQGLLHNLPYRNSYITATKAQVLTLFLNDWEDLLKHFPKSRNAINKHIVPNIDGDFYGDDKSGPTGNLFKSDDQPPSGPMMEQFTARKASIDIGSLRNARSEVFVPPGPSNIAHARAVEKPTRSNNSISSLVESSTTKHPSKELSIEHFGTLEDEDSKNFPDRATDLKNKHSKISAIKKLSILNASPSTSKRAMLNDNVSERIITNESLTLEPDESDKDIQPNTSKNKLQSELKSVEDYIQEQKRREVQSWLENKSSPKVIMEKFKGIAPSISFKKPKAHVRYEDGTPVSHPVEIHELNKMRDSSTDERNIRSLNSDTSPSPKVDKNVTRLPSKSSTESDSSIELDKKTHPKSDN